MTQTLCCCCLLQEQQDDIKRLKQLLADNKPLIERLNKTGSALTKLVGDDEAESVDAIIDSDNLRYEEFKNAIRERTYSLDAALQQTSEFSEKLEQLEETLSVTAQQVDAAEPVAAHPDKLRDQMADNAALLEELDMRMSALEAVRKTADELLGQQGMDDESAKGRGHNPRMYR